MDTIPTSEWIERCARRLAEVDREMHAWESLALARDMERFERTRSMRPEAAVDFVTDVMTRPGDERIERRRHAR